MAGVPIAVDAVGHCERLVREVDRDRFLATLFAPAEARPALLSLFAFNAEIARVREIAREPLPGELRLQWWREALGGGRREEARANPVAAALFDALERHGIAVRPLVELIDARAFDLYDEPMRSLADLERYAEKTSSVLFRIAAQILLRDYAPAADSFSLHAGIAYGVAGVLRAFPRHAARRQLYVPLEILQRHGAHVEDIFAAKATVELRAALAEMRLHARGHLVAANDFLPAAPAAVLPAFLPIALVRPALARMERRAYHPFAVSEIPQWRRQWILWRAARQPRAMTH
ncbi:MAG: phytoene/squalene synthase family protein [Xanthobacteraceae bacterium]